MTTTSLFPFQDYLDIIRAKGLRKLLCIVCHARYAVPMHTVSSKQDILYTVFFAELSTNKNGTLFAAIGGLNNLPNAKIGQ
jgi:hypothetical protein